MAERGSCPKCRRVVAVKKDGTPYGHKHIPQHDWDCHVAFRAGRKCKHGDKQASASKGGAGHG